MGIGTLRRHYTQRTLDEPQEAATPPGVASTAPLPEGFPFKDRLEAAGYHSLEELRAAGEEELIARGLTRRQAARVIEALQELG